MCATKRKNGDEGNTLNIAFGICVVIWRAPCQNFEVPFQLEFLIVGLFDSHVRGVQLSPQFLENCRIMLMSS